MIIKTSQHSLSQDGARWSYGSVRLKTFHSLLTFAFVVSGNSGLKTVKIIELPACVPDSTGEKISKKALVNLLTRCSY